MPAPTVDLAALGADVLWTDREAGTQTAAAMPASLGRLVELAEWLSTVQGTSPPRAPERVRLVRFGAARSAAVDLLAGDLGVSVHVEEPPADVVAAVTAGVALADREIDGGADLLALACPDTELTALVALAVLCDVEPVRVLARGTAATDPQAWMARAEQVRDRRRRAAPLRDRLTELLAELGDTTIAAGVGFLLQAAVRRTPVLLDGLGAAAAALVGYHAQPRLVRWLAAASTSPDVAHALAATALGLRGVLDLGVSVGDGTGALLALPALRSAAVFAADAVGTAPAADALAEREADDDV